MFFWFIATAVVTVGFVFRDPSFDNRLLIVGAVLPGADVVFGGARALHSITLSIVLLAAVMLATKRGSRLRKTLLGLPIGMFLHLVFDAAWNDTDTFWWPFTGLEFVDDGIPIVGPGSREPGARSGGNRRVCLVVADQRPQRPRPDDGSSWRTVVSSPRRRAAGDTD